MSRWERLQEALETMLIVASILFMGLLPTGCSLLMDLLWKQ